MFYVAVTPSPYSRPSFTDFDSEHDAKTHADETRRKMTAGLAGIIWVEIEPNVWATRNSDGSTRFDTMYVEIGKD